MRLRLRKQPRGPRWTHPGMAEGWNRAHNFNMLGQPRRIARRRSDVNLKP